MDRRPSGGRHRGRRLRRPERGARGLNAPWGGRALAAISLVCASILPAPAALGARMPASGSSEEGRAEDGRRSRGGGGRLEAGLSFFGAVAGASHAYLRPGPGDPEVTMVGSASPFVGLRGDRVGLRLTYSPTFQRQALAGVDGVLHEIDLKLGFRPSRSVVLDTMAFGSLADYQAGAAALALPEEGTLPLVATQSEAFGGGVGLRYLPRGDLGARGGLMVTRRSSRAFFVGADAPARVEELFLEGSGLLVWRPSAPVEISAGPVLELRHANRDHLSYRGAGLQASSWARLWRGGGLELSMRAQHNAFGTSPIREDIFVRAGLLVRQEMGENVRASLRYAYTGNGSALAAYDADRHLLLFTLSVRAPTWRSRR